jgi:3-(3-hydroxy-phenyl)propionate hydroxylase
VAPGCPCADAPVRLGSSAGWLLDRLGDGFVLLCFGRVPDEVCRVGSVAARVLRVGIDLVDEKGLLAERYDGRPGTVYLIRPDQYVAARWRRFDATRIEAALRRCLALA